MNFFESLVKTVVVVAVIIVAPLIEQAMPVFVTQTRVTARFQDQRGRVS